MASRTCATFKRIFFQRSIERAILLLLLLILLIILGFPLPGGGVGYSCGMGMGFYHVRAPRGISVSIVLAMPCVIITAASKMASVAQAPGHRPHR
jgi:hypothetical protein